MIGMDAVENFVRAPLRSVQYNYEREIAEKPLVQFNLNGQVLADAGFLACGESKSL